MEEITSFVNGTKRDIAAVKNAIIYGYNNIPEDWLKVLAKKDYLINLAIEFEQKSSILSLFNTFAKKI